MNGSRKEMTETDLIKAVKNSDQAAFRLLSRQYYTQLYGFIWRRTGDAEAAKDILQDLFLNIWRLRENLDDSRSIKPYLFASANNLIINHIKRKSAHNSMFADISPDELSGNTHDMNEYLDDVLKDIPEKLRIVFIMNKFEGFKYSEIAEMLEISEKTVESRMSRILKILRKKFVHMTTLILTIIILRIVFLQL